MRRKAPEEDREFLQNNVAYEASENDLIKVHGQMGCLRERPADRSR